MGTLPRAAARPPSWHSSFQAASQSYLTPVLSALRASRPSPSDVSMGGSRQSTSRGPMWGLGTEGDSAFHSGHLFFLLQKHEDTECPCVVVSCPHKCSVQTLLRSEVGTVAMPGSQGL